MGYLNFRILEFKGNLEIIHLLDFSGKETKVQRG